MSKTVCWQGKCPHGIPICCFECDRKEKCSDTCDIFECYEDGEGEP